MSLPTRPILRTLGTTYGFRQPVTTTYADYGVLGDTERPVWKAWREAEPTTNGLLAGSLGLLLDPYVVAAVQGGAIQIPLVDHLVGIWSSTLAAIFGDRSTHEGVRRLLARQHAQRVPAESLPDWYREHFGDESIVIDPNRRYAVMASLLGAVADAHVATTLVSHGEDGSAYVADLQRTIADANRVNIPMEGPGGEYILRTLSVAAQTYDDQPQMDRAQAIQAGVLGDTGLLQQVLEADLGDGVTIRSLYANFGGLVPKRVRDTLELEWGKSDQRQFDDWAGTYADKVEGGNNNPLDWFDVAARSRSHR